MIIIIIIAIIIIILIIITTTHVWCLPTTNRYFKYDLYGVSNHYGTMDGGHYTAYCKSPDKQVWYKFDDHEVYEHTGIKTHAAYLLFYQASGLNIAASSFGWGSIPC